MYILDCNLHAEGRNVPQIFMEDFGGTVSSGSSRSSSNSRVSTSYDVTTLKSGFNEHSINLPNGCVLKINENGEMLMSEDGGAAKKIRHKDSLQNMLVK